MQNIILISIDISLDNWSTLFGVISVYEFMALRKIVVMGDMA